MRASAFGVSLAWLALFGTSCGTTAQAADQYGGVMPGVAPATGFFEVKQVGNRWLFVTPEGNGMWMTGVYAVTDSAAVDDLGSSGRDRIIAKYGGGPDWRHLWRLYSAKRLKNWGFNTLAEYQHWTTRPGTTFDPNPEAMPYLHIIKPAFYCLDNRGGFAPGPVKDLIHGTDASYYDGWRNSQSPDFFDPNFEAYAEAWMTNDDGLMNGNLGSPWLLGIAMDDMDNIFGFGPGPEVEAGRLHPHLGWIALVTNFEQSTSPWVPSYADRRVHTKYALRDFLAEKYGTVSALNASWGSSYTSFDSAGGWGPGTGLLDENGRHAWVGRWSDDLATASPGVRRDLDEFLYRYAKRYFSIMASKIRAYAPQHLVFGPPAFNGWGGLTRKEILRAAGEEVDVIQAAIGSQQVLELTARYVGNKPIVTWDTVFANPDSALWRYPNLEGVPGWSPVALTQEERGQRYADKLRFLFDGVDTLGVHPVAGIKFWSWGDHWEEKANFGLVTFSDNAYDGQEAVINTGTDPFGWPTGGEERDYGDFLSAVVAANAQVMQSLGGVPLADLAVTKTDGVTTVFSGSPVTYTITVTNNGPAAVTGASVVDNFPAVLTSVSWTCVASAGASCGGGSGSGNINRLVNLPSGGTVTFTATGMVSPSAPAGTLSNTATATVPGGMFDPTPGNNGGNDTDTLMAAADLSITKTDGQTTAAPGQVRTYTIVISNAGPLAANGATVTDSVPASLTGTSWTCVGAGGGTCSPSGGPNINDTVNLPVGGSVTYTLTGTVATNPGVLRNVATVAVPGGMGDPISGNNTAIDEDTLLCFNETVVVPDGRVTTRTMAASATAWFAANVQIGNWYSLEFKNLVGAVSPGPLTLFRGDDGCTGTSTAAPADTSAVDPGGTVGITRISFGTSGFQSFFRARLVNTTGVPLSFSFSWSDTTMYSPAWSTNGAFNTYYSFQNTTGEALNGKLTLVDTAGAVLSTFNLAIPAGQPVSTNTQALGVTRNRTGTAKFTHDGPPGAVLAEAAIANFSLNPAYVQPVKFQPVREARWR
jgi:uncharacterized repeat protein (TIGR01451 family)